MISSELFIFVGLGWQVKVVFASLARTAKVEVYISRFTAC